MAQIPVKKRAIVNGNPIPSGIDTIPVVFQYANFPEYTFDGEITNNIVSVKDAGTVILTATWNGNNQYIVELTANEGEFPEKIFIGENNKTTVTDDFKKAVEYISTPTVLYYGGSYDPSTDDTLPTLSVGHWEIDSIEGWRGFLGKNEFLALTYGELVECLEKGLPCLKFEYGLLQSVYCDYGYTDSACWALVGIMRIDTETATAEVETYGISLKAVL